MFTCVIDLQSHKKNKINKNTARNTGKMDLNSSEDEIELMAQNETDEEISDSFLEKDVEKSMSVRNPFVMSMRFNPIWKYRRAGGSSVKVTVSR